MMYAICIILTIIITLTVDSVFYAIFHYTIGYYIRDFICYVYDKIYYVISPLIHCKPAIWSIKHGINPWHASYQQYFDLSKDQLDEWISILPKKSQENWKKLLMQKNDDYME